MLLTVPMLLLCLAWTWHQCPSHKPCDMKQPSVCVGDRGKGGSKMVRGRSRKRCLVNAGVAARHRGRSLVCHALAGLLGMPLQG